MRFAPSVIADDADSARRGAEAELSALAAPFASRLNPGQFPAGGPGGVGVGGGRVSAGEPRTADSVIRDLQLVGD